MQRREHMVPETPFPLFPPSTAPVEKSSVSHSFHPMSSPSRMHSSFSTTLLPSTLPSKSSTVPCNMSPDEHKIQIFNVLQSVSGVADL